MKKTNLTLFAWVFLLSISFATALTVVNNNLITTESIIAPSCV